MFGVPPLWTSQEFAYSSGIPHQHSLLLPMQIFKTQYRLNRKQRPRTIAKLPNLFCFLSIMPIPHAAIEDDRI